MTERHASGTEVAHPLVARLLHARSAPARILVLGVGSGRNLPPLLAAGMIVDVLEDDAARNARASARFTAEIAARRLRLGPALDLAPGDGYAAVLSTHGLLHGTARAIRARLDAAASRLGPAGELFATLGSRADPRFGRGRRIDGATFAPETGDEAGVPHAYFAEDGARALLAAFDLIELTEGSAAASAGAWAHDAATAGAMRHWFAVGRLRPRAQ